MKPGDGLGGFQIGQRPGDAQDPVIAARRQMHAFGRFDQQGAARGVGRGDFFQDFLRNNMFYNLKNEIIEHIIFDFFIFKQFFL